MRRALAGIVGVVAAVTLVAVPAVAAPDNLWRNRTTAPLTTTPPATPPTTPATSAPSTGAPSTPPTGPGAQATTPPRAQATERILLVGDSITAGTTDVNRSTPGYAPELTRRLNAKGVSHTIVNVAVPGARAEHWVVPRFGMDAPDTQLSGNPRASIDKLTHALRTHKPTVVLLELGTNEWPTTAAAVDKLRTLYGTLVTVVHRYNPATRLGIAIGIQISVEDGTGVQQREHTMNTKVLDPLWTRYGPGGLGWIKFRVDWRPLAQTGLSSDRIHPSYPTGYDVRGRGWAQAGWGA